MSMTILCAPRPCACRGVRHCAQCRPDIFIETFGSSGDIGSLKPSNQLTPSCRVLDEHDRGSNNSRICMAEAESVSREKDMPKLYSYCYCCHCAYPRLRVRSAEDEGPCERDEQSLAGVDGACKHDVAPRSMDFLLPGLYLWPDFITESEEELLVGCIDRHNWVESQSGRRKQDFGPKVNFKKQKVNIASFTGLPDYSRFLLECMTNRDDSKDLLADFRCAELCNLEYTRQRGSHIEPHTDDAWLWGERLVSVNLLSDTFLCLTPTEAFAEQSGIALETSVLVPMPRRSLFVMKGQARYQWKHAVRPEDVGNRRLVMTFRELTEEFLTGESSSMGQKILETAYSFKGQPVGSA